MLVLLLHDKEGKAREKARKYRRYPHAPTMNANVRYTNMIPPFSPFLFIPGSLLAKGIIIGKRMSRRVQPFSSGDDIHNRATYINWYQNKESPETWYRRNSYTHSNVPMTREKRKEEQREQNNSLNVSWNLSPRTTFLCRCILLLTLIDILCHIP